VDAPGVAQLLEFKVLLVAVFDEVFLLLVEIVESDIG
jgi:hypothetical protein